MRPSPDKRSEQTRTETGAAGTAAPTGEAPRIWILTGHRRGDNAQVRALASALGWPFTEIALTHNGLRYVPNGLLGATRAGIRHVSERLQPPWPDLVIGIGQRSVPVARWIKQQAEGGTKLVHLGRPMAPLAWFDLVITTPQYGLPATGNVLHNLLPMHGVTTRALADAAQAWRDTFAHLPRPRVACFLGGPTGSHALDAAQARRIAGHADALAARADGSVMLTTGPRTPAAAADAAEHALSVRRAIYRWDRHGGQPNPVLAYLALADRFVVSGESVSVVAEACATGKPVHVAPVRRKLRHHLARAATRVIGGAVPATVRRGVISPARDVDAVHTALVRAGLACWDGDLLRIDEPPHAAADATIRSVAAVRKLLGVAPAVPPNLAYAGAETAAAPRA